MRDETAAELRAAETRGLGLERDLMVSRAKEEAVAERIADLSRQRDASTAEASAAAEALAAARAAQVEAVHAARSEVTEAAEAERGALLARLQAAEAQRDEAREKGGATATELGIVRAKGEMAAREAERLQSELGSAKTALEARCARRPCHAFIHRDHPTPCTHAHPHPAAVATCTAPI